MKNVLFSLGLFALLMVSAVSAYAIEVAHPLGFPSPASTVAESITFTYNFIYWICLFIFIIVQMLVLVVIWKFRRSKNPTPATFTHNNLLEIVWTGIPVLLCVAIAWVSFESLFFIRKMPEQGETVEVIAFQFGWDFDYPDYEIGSAEAVGADPDLSVPGVERYVKDMVVPVDTNVKLHITARDVIHAYYVPALGLKIDAIPGRINYAWFNATKKGSFIGQCAELCGSAHGEMFFRVNVVSKEEYHDWLNGRRSAKGLEAIDTLAVDSLPPEAEPALGSAGVAL